jgi:hypothetical protein
VFKKPPFSYGEQEIIFIPMTVQGTHGETQNVGFATHFSSFSTIGLAGHKNSI